LPLSIGAKLTVRVLQLRPQVVLSIVQPEDPASTLTSRYASFSRANPEALRDIFLTGRDIFGDAPLLAALPGKTQKILRSIVAVLDSLMFSTASGKDQFSLKNYLSNLGMLLEFDLRQAIEGKNDLNDLKQDGLKGLLLKLAVELKAQEAKENSPESLRNLGKLIEFTEKAVKTIEGFQIINVQSGAKEGDIFFQIPVVLPGDVRMADLYINTEKDKNDPDGGRRHQVVMFLSLDALGEMMVEASLTGNKLGCVLKIADPAVQEFISGFVRELEKNIRDIGFADVYLTCIHSDSIGKTKSEYYQQLFFDRDAINVFA
jgi:hypothetical protein